MPLGAAAAAAAAQILYPRLGFCSLHGSQKPFRGARSRTACRLSEPGSEWRSPNPRYDSLSLDSLELQQLHLSVKEAGVGDYWEVSDTHCSAFLPDLIFPMDMLLRLDRFLAMFGSLLLPMGCERKWLIAVASERCKSCWERLDDSYNDNSKIGTILGVLMVDTVAEFLPKRKSTQKRRSGIAYISNVAVRKRARRKGIARSLIREAEKAAASWGCRSIALHCDRNNPAALGLYSRAGYKVVKAPANVKWPQPKSVSSSELCLMMKCLVFG